MADRLAYQDSDKTVWVITEPAGGVGGVAQVERVDWVHPQRAAAAQAVAGLRTVADSSGALTLLQLSNAVRSVASALIVIIRILLTE